MINCFDGEFAFLSNFYESPIEFEGIVYPTNEHFFQAMKTLDINERRTIANCATPGQAKRMGRRVSLRSDWEQVKEDIMFQGLCIKFTDRLLSSWLLETGNEELVEGTTWHDNEWGNCSCPKCAHIEGKNKLGKLLMRVRDMIREERGLI